MGQAVLRGDEDRERVGGRVGENSRDGPKDDPSGLEPAKVPSVLTNITRSDIEEESESSEADVGSRMGSLTNAHTSERGATSETVLDSDSQPGRSGKRSNRGGGGRGRQ